jgi:hypothetical protein
MSLLLLIRVSSLVLNPAFRAMIRMVGQKRTCFIRPATVRFHLTTAPRVIKGGRNNDVFSISKVCNDLYGNDVPVADEPGSS